ncbi:hypothetical protein GMSM_26760 [Geomonas sp. Red276]
MTGLPKLPRAVSRTGNSLPGPKPLKKPKKKPFDLSFERYCELRNELATTSDLTEKNRIYRRLVNLLDVMQFLTSQQMPG